MTAAISTTNFVIQSLPRCGSTTLAKILNCLPGIRCLIEPFHPQRYEGKFHLRALQDGSVSASLEMIWAKWNGIKHVWESSGWPFRDNPGLNEQMLLVPNQKTISLVRRNYLKRFVSNYICWHTRYWIGTKEEFYWRFTNTKLPRLSTELALAQINDDREAVLHRLKFIADNKIPSLLLFYEDVFNPALTAQEQLNILNAILNFLSYAPVSAEVFEAQCRVYFDASLNQWSSPEIYRCIPGIAELENEGGSDDNGWLFR